MQSWKECMLERNQKMKTNLFWDLVKNGLCAETTCDASLIRKQKTKLKGERQGLVTHLPRQLR